MEIFDNKRLFVFPPFDSARPFWGWAVLGKFLLPRHIFTVPGAVKAVRCVDYSGGSFARRAANIDSHSFIYVCACVA
jgi:hypothetical protein